MGSLTNSKIAIVVFSIVLFSAHANTINETDEVIFFKRIKEAYETSDNSTFFSHLAKYVRAFPESANIDKLLAFAGNILYKNKVYSKAVRAYEMISDSDVWNDVQLKYLKSQFKLDNYEIVIDCLVNDFQEINSVEKELLLKSFDFVITDEKRDKKLKLHYANWAISIYESFEGSELTLSRLKTVEKYYFLTKKYEKTAYVLKKIASLDNENKEKILLRLSDAQMHFDKDEAVKTLNEICSMDGELKSHASRNKLMLCFEKNQFEQIILSKDEFKESLNQEHLPFFHYALGISYLNRGEITQAEIELNSYLANTGEYQSLEENVLVLLANVAMKKNDPNKFQQIVGRLNPIRQLKLMTEPEERKLDPLVLARSYKEKKEYNKAEQQLKTLLIKTNKGEKKVLVHFELALLYYDTKNWEKAREYFNEFVEGYSHSSLTQLAWDYFIQSSIHLSQDDRHHFGKAQLIYDLESLLDVNRSEMDKYEIQKYMLLLAQTKYQINAYEEAIETLKVLIGEQPSNKILSECLVLLAYSYRFGFNDQQKYTILIEKAMEIEPNLNLDEYNQNKLSEFNLSN